MFLESVDLWIAPQPQLKKLALLKLSLEIISFHNTLSSGIYKKMAK